MRFLIILFILTLQLSCTSYKITTTESALQYDVHSAMQWQSELNQKYANQETSPLKPIDLKKFNKLPFYKASEKYIVIAHLKKTADALPFNMPTTTGRKTSYKVYGVATFQLDGKEHRLNIYQNLDLIKNPIYKDYLFLPYLDLTNGEETYPGGRYVDLKASDGDTVIIDFNRSYNPYCAYNDNYSCPIPPRENTLDIPILAGVQYQEIKF